MGILHKILTEEGEKRRKPEVNVEAKRYEEDKENKKFEVRNSNGDGCSET